MGFLFFGLFFILLACAFGIDFFLSFSFSEIYSFLDEFYHQHDGDEAEGRPPGENDSSLYVL